MQLMICHTIVDWDTNANLFLKKFLKKLLKTIKYPINDIP